MEGTRGEGYTRRLAKTDPTSWNSRLVQLPYRWNLRRHDLGVTLDIGCGVGRHLDSLASGSLGVDHNVHSVSVARGRGLSAMTVGEWDTIAGDYHDHFDSLLIAHVIEHLPAADARELLKKYLPVLRPGGKVLMICPQERGYRSDPTHVTWTTGAHLELLASECGLTSQHCRSFPFPRWAGKAFTHNESTVLAVKTGGSA